LTRAVQDSLDCLQSRADGLRTENEALRRENQELVRQLAMGASFKSAVIAFDQPCPNGWTEFTDAAGRVIIGVGRGEGLTSRARGDTGGEEKHTLTVNEMPSHSHAIFRPADPSNDDELFVAGGTIRRSGPLPTERTGGGQPHNNMQPYIALYFCKKD
jgi:hypothetical protein